MVKKKRKTGMRNKRTRRPDTYQPNNPLTIYFERMFAKQRKSK